MKKNRFTKALKHIKKDLSEVAPTNSMGGVYSLNDPGFSLKPHSAPKTFLPDIDGNFPSGIPGNAGDATYTRPGGIWTGEVDWDETVQGNFAQDSQGDDGNSTVGLISNEGTVFTALPPNTRSFILGPLVDGFVYNHGYDAYTRLGYMQKDTRQFVLLAKFTGAWSSNAPFLSSGVYDNSSNAYNWATWDGTATGFTSYNSSFTLAHAQWMRTEFLAGRYMKNSAYRSSGGIGQSFNNPGGVLEGLGNFFKGAGFGGGSGDAANGGPGGGYGSGGNPTIGTQQTDAPQKGDAEDAGFPWFPFGKLGKKAKELWDSLIDKGENIGEFLEDAFDDAVEGAKDFRDSLREVLKDAGKKAQRGYEKADQWAKDNLDVPKLAKELGDNAQNLGKSVADWKGIDGKGMTLADKAKFIPQALVTTWRLANAVPEGKAAMDNFMDNNNPESENFGKNTPGHPNYEGPKELYFDKNAKQNIQNHLNKGLQELGIDLSTDRNLTAAEIKKISDYMAKGEKDDATGQFKGTEASMEFYVTFWSLPPDVTTISIKNGEVEYVNSNYLFTDKSDVSIGGPITQIPMGNTARKLSKYYEQNPDQKLNTGNYQSHQYTKKPASVSDKQSETLFSTDGGKTWWDFNDPKSPSGVDIGNANKSGTYRNKPNPNAGKVARNEVIGILNPMEIQITFGNKGKKNVKESYGLRRVKFVMNEIAVSPTDTQTTTQQSTTEKTDSKKTADTLAKEYIEKNGPEKTQELIDKTDEYIKSHDKGQVEPEISHDQSDVDKEGMQQEVESEIDNDSELNDEQKQKTKRAHALAVRKNAQIDADNLNPNKVKSFLKNKHDNNLKIALSIISSRIISHTYSRNLQDEYFNSISANITFMKHFNNPATIPIVDKEMGYADDNFYVENGKFYDNTSDTHQQVKRYDLTNESHFKAIGQGMSQLVIPSDGGVPYLIFKDYNYHNLRSLDPGEIPGGGAPGWKNWVRHKLTSALSGGAHSIGFMTDLISLRNPFGSITNGVPWGIHGMTYTEFQRSVDELPEEVRNMIMSHPLYWNETRLNDTVQDAEKNQAEYDRMWKLDSDLWEKTFDKTFANSQHRRLKKIHDEWDIAWKKKNDDISSVEKEKWQQYYDYNSKKWGGYTDQDPDSPTYNTWVDNPQPEPTEAQQWEEAGLSYNTYDAARNAAGTDSSGEIANYKQIMDGESGLTGLAGKAVEAGNKLREIESNLAKGHRMTSDEEQYKKWKKAEADHPAAYEAYKSAFAAWENQVSSVQQQYDNYLEKSKEFKQKYLEDYETSQTEFENQIEKIKYDYAILEGEFEHESEPLWEPFDKDFITGFHSSYMDKKPGYSMIPKESYVPPNPSKKAYKFKKWERFERGSERASALGVDDATTAASVAGERKKKKKTEQPNSVFADYKPSGRRLHESDLNLSRRQVRMLKEIKKPILVEELPQQKLKKYRPNFKGRFSPQNTPDKTASKESDALVMSGNQKGQAWRTADKYWSGYETTERMNVISDRVGHGQMAWDMIVDEARQKNGWKNREIQEHLNIIAAEKAMREEFPNYESPFGYVIHEQGASTEEELDTVMKDPIVKKVAKRLRTQIDYKDKPSRKGFPDEPPKKQEDGWHPDYGKKYKYDKLDPQSAEAMPPTGNPEIDANVDKAKPKPPRWKHINTESRVDPKVKWDESVDWRKELNKID